MRAALCALALAAALPAFAEAGKAADPMVARGRYLVSVAGCNDCHTPNFPMKDGKVAEAEWLTGDGLGWHGPWGTTYAPNLRLYMSSLGEKEWVARAKALKTRPPMPWFNVQRMSERDLRAIYRYVRHLGPAGKPAPAYLPPGQTPPLPYMELKVPPAR